jgi:hypothetical protein
VKRARVGAAGAARAEEAHTVGLYAMAERDLGLSGCSPYRINRVGVEWSGVEWATGTTGMPGGMRKEARPRPGIRFGYLGYLPVEYGWYGKSHVSDLN